MALKVVAKTVVFKDSKAVAFGSPNNDFQIDKTRGYDSLVMEVPENMKLINRTKDEIQSEASLMQLLDNIM